MILRIALISTLFLFGCARYEKRGYMDDRFDSANLSAGLTDARNVFQIMGSPTIISDSGKSETWIYFSEDVKELMFFKPKVVSRRIYEIKFDDNGLIDSVSKYSLADQTKLYFHLRHTYIASANENWIKDIFSNIGNVRP